MSIKPDTWIKKMAKEEDMISPFEPEQVKALSGEKVISYGVSSYGYDVRCSSMFKVFTNINSAVVDPKKFDKNSFAKSIEEKPLRPKRKAKINRQTLIKILLYL